MSDPDNCVLAKDGTLKDANNIRFFNLPSDKHHIGYKGSGSDDDTGWATSSGSDLPTVIPLLERALIIKGKRHSQKTEKVKRMEVEKSKGKGRGEGAEVHPCFKKGNIDISIFTTNSHSLIGTSTKPTGMFIWLYLDTH
jgi:hypothetical protein